MEDFMATVLSRPTDKVDHLGAVASNLSSAPQNLLCLEKFVLNI